MLLEALLALAQVALPVPAEASLRFGQTLAADDDVLVVACGVDWPARRVRTPPVFGYDRVDGQWSDPAPLRPELGGSGVLYSTPVTVDGDRAVIGLPLDPNYSRTREGSNYVYQRTSVRSAAAFQRSGVSAGEPKAGAIYGFRHDGRSWIPAGPPIVGDPSTQAEFAASMALAGDEVLVGAPGADRGRGAVFAYSLSAHFPEVARVVAGDDRPR